MKKQYIKLSNTDRAILTDMVGKSVYRSRVLKRALGLLSLDEGETLQSVAKQVRVHYVTVGNWRDIYNNEGLHSALNDNPRSGRPIEIDGTERAKLTALASSDAPQGYCKWSLRLLADKVVELGYCEHISHTHVGNVLKKTN